MCGIRCDRRGASTAAGAKTITNAAVSKRDPQPRRHSRAAAADASAASPNHTTALRVLLTTNCPVAFWRPGLPIGSCMDPESIPQSPASPRRPASATPDIVVPRHCGPRFDSVPIVKYCSDVYQNITTAATELSRYYARLSPALRAGSACATRIVGTMAGASQPIRINQVCAHQCAHDAQAATAACGSRRGRSACHR